MTDHHDVNHGFGDAARIVLINKYKEFLAERSKLGSGWGSAVDPTVWAFLWIAPMEQLQSCSMRDLHSYLQLAHETKLLPLWLQNIRSDSTMLSSSPSNRSTPSLVMSSPLMPPPPRPSQGSPLAPQPSAQAPIPLPSVEPPTPAKRRKRTASQADLPPTASNQSPSTRLQAPIELARKRDSYKCMITSVQASVEIAHIYPHSMNPDGRLSKRSAQFWDRLEEFWGPEKTAEWKAAVLPAKIDSPANFLSLQSFLHGLWGKALFAIKPISITEDKTCMTVRFFWMKMHRHSEPIEPTTVPDLQTDDPEVGSMQSVVAKFGPPRRFLASGDEFVWTTENPATQPLPSMSLLELQWNLHRIAALAGGGEDDDEDDDEAVCDPLEALQDQADRRYTHWALLETGKIPSRAAGAESQPQLFM